MSYEIATDVYQGPFDLLLQLIMSDEVDIWEVELSSIIAAFQRESESLTTDRIDLDVATEFLLIASTLIEIKVKRLMPRPETVDLDEELLTFEYRDLLLARLLECKTFKDVAAVFSTMISVSSLRAPRVMPVEEPFFSMAPDPLASTPPEKLRDAFKRVFTAPEKPEVSVVHLHDAAMSVKDAVNDLLDRLEIGQHTSFKKLMENAPSKLHIVVNFLAVLELYKQGFIDIDQAESLGDLTVSLLHERDMGEIDVNADDWGEVDAAVSSHKG
jgi:segregation and condensation protein A